MKRADGHARGRRARSSAPTSLRLVAHRRLLPRGGARGLHPDAAQPRRAGRGRPRRHAARREHRSTSPAWSSGASSVGGMALSLFHVDDPVPDDVLAQLRTLPHIVSARAAAALRRAWLPPSIIGAQWGDEGKGKIVDLLAARRRHRRALPGRQQRRPHAGRRRREDRPAPDPVRRAAPRQDLRASATAW